MINGFAAVPICPEITETNITAWDTGMPTDENILKLTEVSIEEGQLIWQWMAAQSKN